MREAVIVASSRTPLAKSHRGSFNLTRPDDLAAHCIQHVLGKAPQLDPPEIEEVILGCGQPHGPQGHNIARVAALRAGLPVTIAGLTVNRFCTSGLQAIVQAAHMIISEGADVVDRRRRRVDHDGAARQLAEPVGAGAATRASTWSWARRPRSSPSATTISREAQDEYALVEPAAHGARAAGGLLRRRDRADGGHARRPRQEDRREVGEETVYVETRRVQSRRHDARGLGEAAAACSTRRAGRAASRPATPRSCPTARRRRCVMSMDRAKALGVEPRLVFRGFAVAGCEPDEMGIGPVFAVPKLLRAARPAGRRHRRVGAERSVRLAGRSTAATGWAFDPDRLNVNGGSIAIGHPFGMTGSRLVGTLANEMLRRKARYGVVTMCVGGGQGAAALFERA